MKRIILILTVLFLSTGGIAGNVRKTGLTALIYEYKGYDGVELVKLGPIETSLLKSAIRASAKRDDGPDSEQILKIIRGVRRLIVFDYDDCEQVVKDKINKKLNRIFKDSELLMEAKDGDDTMQMFGVTDEKCGTVSDFILYNPGECSLICIFGKISMDAVAKLVENND